MTKAFRLALPQIAPIWLNRAATLDKVQRVTAEAAINGAHLVVFGEGLVPGYPFWISGTGGAKFNDDKQKELFAYYSDQAVDIEAGHLDELCKIAQVAEIAIYLGIIERARDRSGHSLYCSYVFIDAQGQIKSVHRKLQPTYEERLVWAPGDGAGLVTHKLGGFTLGALNCWENWMPLSRAALYGQGEDLHIACWPGSVRNTEDITPFLAKEGRSYAVSVSSLMRRSDVASSLPYADDIRSAIGDMPADGGSCLAAPDGSWVLEPTTGEEMMRFADLDPAFVRRERQNFDPAGHYSRPDVTRLVVNRKRQALTEFED